MRGGPAGHANAIWVPAMLQSVGLGETRGEGGRGPRDPSESVYEKQIGIPGWRKSWRFTALDRSIGAGRAMAMVRRGK